MNVGDLVRYNRDNTLGIITYVWVSDRLSVELVEVMWADGHRSDTTTYHIEKVDKI